MYLARNIGRGIATVATFAAGTLATAVLLLLILQSHELLERVTSDSGIALVELLKFAVPIAGGALLARPVWKRLKSKSLKGQVAVGASRQARVRFGLWAVGLAYVFTAILGSPAVQNSLDLRAFDAWKQLEARDHRPGWQKYPSIKTLLALPIAPGLIVTYHEFQIGSLGGWGGWELYLWYGSEPKQLLRLTSWMS